MKVKMSSNSSLLCFLILTASVFLSLDKTSAQHDQCSNNECCSKGGGGGYAEINDARRSRENQYKAGGSAICDRTLKWGWYRFTSYVGGKMPTSKVALMRCGTVHPVWMRGVHPRAVDGVKNYDACINFFNTGDYCFVTLPIKVKYCQGNPEFWVYYLGPTYSCSLAYCAGFRKPCPSGQTGNPCKPVKNVPPRIFDNRNLGTPLIQVIPEVHVPVSLLCKVELLQGIEKRDDVEYKIEWTSQGKILETTSKCSQTDKIQCPNEKYIQSKLEGIAHYNAGIWVSCNVSAKYKDTGSKWSTPKEVKNHFFAGVEVFPTTLKIDLDACDKQKGNKITVRPTIPMRKNPNTGQFTKASFVLPKKGLKLRDKNCKSADFDLKGTDPFVVDVLPDCDALKKDTKSTKVIVVTMIPNHPFWRKTFLRTIWVSIIMPHVEQCKTYTDPHYHAMEKIGTTRSFDFMGHGDFILYRNQEKNFEVHTRQWTCNYPGVTCNCGAVLRDHNDVIEFNCCNKNLKFQNSHPTPLQVKLRSKKCLRPGIHLRKKFNGGNNDYTVIFPTGVQVDIVRNYWGIDVTIITNRAKSRNNEAGICLYKTGNINDYGNKQRIQPGRSYFDTLPPNIDDTTANYMALCGNQAPFHVPTFIKDRKTAFNLCDRTTKREVFYSDELTDEDYDLFKQLPPSENRQRFERAMPTTVIPLKNATRYCAQMIANSKVGKICASQGVDVQSFVDSCSLDVSLTGVYSFAMGIASMLTKECGYVAAINASSVRTNESSDEVESVGSLQTEISELLCPNDCAFNGDCVNGSCVCYKDYTAEDCSISVYQKPSISRLQGDGLCDRRIRPCKKVTVMGTGWLNSTNITCHLREFKVVNSSWNPNPSELRFPGIMVDLLLVDCYLPYSPVKQGYFDENIGGTPAAGLTVSVSNDGVHKSNQNLTLISYDSVCMVCSVSKGCHRKDSSCFINNYCFAPNEVHPDDWCFQCLPDVDKNTWTKRRVNHSPNITSRKDYYALYNENLELLFDVVDPEGMPVTISLLDGSPKDAVLRDKVLYWNVTSDRVTTFHLRATDICQASTNFTITISLVSCQCQNNGSCLPVAPRGSGFYLCDCPPGFTGARCETNMDECQTYPCVQGLCIDGINNYTCQCDLGYVGRHCDQNRDECASSPCVHGNCTDLVNGYTCNCHLGYVGTHCDENIDECLSSPCFYGTCSDQINDYTCQCEAGYTGKDCDVDIDECQSSPCINGNCTDQVNGFSCRCQTGFNGTRCEFNIDDCLPVSCGNGTCIDLLNNYSCICKVGYTGQHCEILITRCDRDSCYPGVQCTEISHSISCGPCPTGFTGDGKTCKDIDDCVNHLCANGGTCEDGVNSYSCKCLPGFSGNRCQNNIDDCSNHTCQNGASCVDGVNDYSCACVQGFTGQSCETNIDDCHNHTCHNGASCVDGINDYSCTCVAGFTGSSCKIEIDDCVNHTCANGGSCVDGVNSYSCKCVAGFSGNHCQNNIDDCHNHTCQNGASCVDGVNGYSCTCVLGFTGQSCETNINDCVNHTCANGGTCVDGVNSYSCKCAAGLSGNRCQNNIDDCHNHTCQNGASCIDGVNDYLCTCLVGFTGSKCETDIDDCVNHTCTNGGTCEDGFNSYSCKCVAGFSGNHCQNNIDDCRNHTCQNGASCVDGVNDYSCTCVQGFTGQSCETNIDDCHNHTCHNGAACVDGINDYSCTCVAGFTGSSCKIDVDDCHNHTCQNGASCVDGVNGYSCTCVLGFTGQSCETNIDNCVNHACVNNGTCIDGVDSYSCKCAAGFTGNHCQNNFYDCRNHTCQNGASCVDGVNDYLCTCLVGFTGSSCETDIDDCVNHTCTNGGTCEDGVNSYSCKCVAGFSGNHCQTILTSVNEQPSSKTSPSPSASRAMSSKTSTAVTATTVRAFETSSSSVRKSQTINLLSPSREVRISSSIRLTTAQSSQTVSLPPLTDASRTDKPATEKITTDALEKEEPETEEATTEESKTELIMELHVEMTWNDELSDKNSAAFKDLSQVFEKEIKEQYSKDDNFVAVKVLSFRKGSVLVEFKLEFKEKLKEEEALAPLNEGLKEGRMGSLRVDPESLKVKNDREDLQAAESKMSWEIGIGISVGGIFFLALITIALVRYRKRCNGRIQRRSSCGMPTEVSLSNLATYALRDESGGNVPDEEILVSHVGKNRYETLGISNEGVQYEKLDGSSSTTSPPEDLGTLNKALSYDELNISTDVGKCA